jgi:hypothetical protein
MALKFIIIISVPCCRLFDHQLQAYMIVQGLGAWALRRPNSDMMIRTTKCSASLHKPDMIRSGLEPDMIRSGLE